MVNKLKILCPPRDMFWRLNLAISKIDNRKFNKMIDSFDCTRETDIAES